jgi:predicted nucleic acid-binding protein
LKIVFDTNVILDVLLAREPHLKLSETLFCEVERGNIQGYLCATTITTIDYFLAKASNRETAKITIDKLLRLFSIAEVNSSVLKKSLDLDFSDFEDAVLYQSGVNVGVDGFVTRNKKDFKTALLPVYTPSELLELIKK